MISNTLYAEGDHVEGFKVEQINPAKVLSGNGPYKYELMMSKVVWDESFQFVSCQLPVNRRRPGISLGTDH